MSLKTEKDASPAAVFAYALEELPGVGRVSAGRLLDSFGTYERLLRFPREQVLLRLKGLPHAADLVATLFDSVKMEELLAASRSRLGELTARNIRVLSPPDKDWPAQLDELPASSRPNLLYGYGDVGLLLRPGVAVVARAPLSDLAFDLAQSLLRRLFAAGVQVLVGTSGGFDVVAGKLASDAGQALVLVASSGLTRIPRTFRPVAAAAVREGGLLCSGFAMGHGPFEHDERDRFLLQSTLAKAVVFVDPGDRTLENEAIVHAVESRRAVFGLRGPRTAIPEAVHVLATPADFDSVIAAVGGPGSGA